MTSAERILETVASDDGACRWVLRNRLDGRFDYTEHRFVDLRPDGQVEGYWKRSYISGIFETAQAARDDALESIAWLPGRAFALCEVLLCQNLLPISLRCS